MLLYHGYAYRYDTDTNTDIIDTTYDVDTVHMGHSTGRDRTVTFSCILDSKRASDILQKRVLIAFPYHRIALR